MKNIILLSCLLLTSLFSDELAWVDKQIEAIKPVRSGVDLKKLKKLKDPFIFLSENHYRDYKKDRRKVKTYTVLPSHQKKIYKKRKKHSLVYVNLKVSLDAIMNKSALINGRWYKVGNSVKGFKVVKITSNSVILVKDNKRAILSIKAKVKKFNIEIN